MVQMLEDCPSLQVISKVYVSRSGANQMCMTSESMHLYKHRHIWWHLDFSCMYTANKLTQAASCAKVVYHALRSSDASFLAAQQIPSVTFFSLALPSTCLPWYRYTCMLNVPADESRCIATVALYGIKTNNRHLAEKQQEAGCEVCRSDAK